MSKIKISTGDLVEVTIFNQAERTQPYLSEVEYFDDKKKTVLIHSPILSGVYLRLPKEKYYSLKFVSKKGIVRFNATVNRYTSEKNIQFTELKLSGHGVHIQQRNFFRLPCSIPFVFSLGTEDESGIHFPDEENSGIIQDLSGGGVKIAAKLKMTKHALIKFKLQLDDNSFELTGEIRSKFHNQYSIRHIYGVMFTGLSKIDQEKIVLYIHNRQLKKVQTTRLTP